LEDGAPVRPVSACQARTASGRLPEETDSWRPERRIALEALIARRGRDGYNRRPIEMPLSPASGSSLHALERESSDDGSPMESTRGRGACGPCDCGRRCWSIRRRKSIASWSKGCTSP